MNDAERLLRAHFEEVLNSLAPSEPMPDEIKQRIQEKRRRRLWATSLVGAVCVGAGAIVLLSFSGTTQRVARLETGSQPSSAPSRDSRSPTPRCQAKDLAITGGRQSGGSNFVAAADIALTNTSPGACRLSVRPRVSLYADGHVLPVSFTLPRRVKVQPVRMDPGVVDAGWIHLDWTNWCGAHFTQLSVHVALGAGHSSLSGSFDGPPDYKYWPVCRQKGKPSSLTLVSAYRPQ